MQTRRTGYSNLIDTTLLLTPNAKFNAYLNYDYGQNHDAITEPGRPRGRQQSEHWQGVAFAAHEQSTGTSAVAGRFEFFHDMNGFSTGVAQEREGIHRDL